MNKLQKFFSIFWNILDKIAYGILFLTAAGILLNLDFFALNLNQYDEEIVIAYNCLRYFSLFLAGLILLFLMRKKYPKIVYIEYVLWLILFGYTPYLFHQIPSVSQSYNGVTYNRSSK